MKKKGQETFYIQHSSVSLGEVTELGELGRQVSVVKKWIEDIKYHYKENTEYYKYNLKHYIYRKSYLTINNASQRQLTHF